MDMLPPLRVLASQEICPSLEDEIDIYRTREVNTEDGGVVEKGPTHHIRMVKGRLLRHLLATPPLAFVDGFWRRTPLYAILATFRKRKPFPIIPATLWRHAPFLEVFVRFLSRLLQLRFSGSADVLQSLANTVKSGLRPAATDQNCGAASYRGPRASPFAALLNCAKR